MHMLLFACLHAGCPGQPPQLVPWLQAALPPDWQPARRLRCVGLLHSCRAAPACSAPVHAMRDLGCAEGGGRGSTAWPQRPKGSCSRGKHTEGAVSHQLCAPGPCPGSPAGFDPLGLGTDSNNLKW